MKRERWSFRRTYVRTGDDACEFSLKRQRVAPRDYLLWGEDYDASVALHIRDECCYKTWWQIYSRAPNISTRTTAISRDWTPFELFVGLSGTEHIRREFHPKQTQKKCLLTNEWNDITCEITSSLVNSILKSNNKIKLLILIFAITCCFCHK